MIDWWFDNKDMVEMMQKQRLDNHEDCKIMYQVRCDPRIRRHTITGYSVHLSDLIQLWTASRTMVYKAQISATGACWNSVLLNSHHPSSPLSPLQFICIPTSYRCFSVINPWIETHVRIAFVVYWKMENNEKKRKKRRES